MAGTVNRASWRFRAPRRVRALAAVSIVVAIALGGAACGGDDTDTVQSGGGGNGGGGATQPGGDTSAQSFVGLSKRAAIAKAKADGRDWRIIREDDETFPATLDYVETRVNFEIDDGKVTKATFG